MEIPAFAPAMEAILFAAGDSVPCQRIAQVLGLSSEEVEEAADALAEDYVRRGSGIRLLRLGENLQLCSAPEYADEITRALEKRRPPRLSQTALEVLSIVAYFQPVTRAYIEQVRGVDSSYTVSGLLQRGLIEPCGQLEAPGRPTLFRTTETFLRCAGLRSLEELPPLPESEPSENMKELLAAMEKAEEEKQ